MNSQRIFRALSLSALLLAGLLLVAPSVRAQSGITFSFDNVETTDTGIAFDVLAAGDAGATLGDAQVYLDYDEAAFGSAVTENSRITASLGPALAAHGTYFDPLLNDNTDARVSLVAEYLGPEGQGLALDGAAVVLFHVEMETLGEGGTTAISFHETLMEGQQFTSDYTTVFADVLASDLLEIELPTDLAPIVRAETESEGAVLVNWTAPRPAAGNFKLEHAEGPEGLFRQVADVAQQAAKAGGTYEYLFDGLAFGTHRFRIGQANKKGEMIYSEPVEIQVEMVERFVLDPAYPNPFNPEATVRFAVKESEDVAMVMYNALGQRVRTLYSGRPDASTYQQVRIDGSGLASGLYFVHLRGESFVATQQVILMK